MKGKKTQISDELELNSASIRIAKEFGSINQIIFYSYSENI